jgi:hypothetical protein
MFTLFQLDILSIGGEEVQKWGRKHKEWAKIEGGGKRKKEGK